MYISTWLHPILKTRKEYEKLSHFIKTSCCVERYLGTDVAGGGNCVNKNGSVNGERKVCRWQHGKYLLKTLPIITRNWASIFLVMVAAMCCCSWCQLCLYEFIHHLLMHICLSFHVAVYNPLHVPLWNRISKMKFYMVLMGSLRRHSP